MGDSSQDRSSAGRLQRQRKACEDMYPLLVDPVNPECNTNKRGRGELLVRDDSFLSRRSEQCHKLAALLASSHANMMERAHPRLYEEERLSKLALSRSDVVVDFGMPNDWILKLSSDSDKGTDLGGKVVEDEDEGFDGGEQANLVVEPHLSLDIASFLRSFLPYAAPPECAQVQFNESGLQALAILVDELIKDMLRKWKQIGAPLGEKVSKDAVKRAVIAQVNGTVLDDKKNSTRPFIEQIVNSMFAQDEAEDQCTRDAVSEVFQPKKKR